jgi:hypothetical protein
VAQALALAAQVLLRVGFQPGGVLDERAQLREARFRGGRADL